MTELAPTTLSCILRAQKFTNYEDMIHAVCNDGRVQSFLNFMDYHFKRPQFLVEALTHRSFAHETHSMELPFNERLEFLGDSLLGTLVAQALFHRFPDSQEGDLSRMRASLVNEEALNDLARFLKIDEFVLLGRGEEKNQGNLRSSILSSTFEALMGAIFLDSDESVLRQVSIRILAQYQEARGQAYFQEVGLDPKSELQEKTMAMYQSLPQYHFVEVGKGKDKLFEVSLTIKGKLIGSERNISKKKAQKNLAKKALEEKLYEL